MVWDYGFPYNLVCYRKYQAEIVKGPMVWDYGFPHNLICYKKYKYEIMVGSMVSDYEASGGLVYAREIRLLDLASNFFEEGISPGGPSQVIQRQ